MFKISARFWLLASLIVAINVAGLLIIRNEIHSRPIPGLRLLSVSPSGDVGEADRFTLRFDEPIARVEECGARIEHSPFMIEPAPPGHWRWEEPDQLVYLLDEKLPPGRRYVIRPAADSDTRLGRRIIGQSEYTFTTQPLRFHSARVIASDRSDVTVALKFNQPVRPGDLLRHLTIRGDKARANAPVQCLTQEAASELTLRFARPGEDHIRIIFAPQLTGDGGTLPLEKEISTTLSIAPVFKLTGAQADEPRASKAGSNVNLQFTQPLDESQSISNDAIILEPRVANLKAFPSKEGRYLILQGEFEIGQRYTVSVSANLLSSKKETLGSAQSTSFTIPDRDPSLIIPDNRGILSPHGNLLLDMKAVNVEAFTLSAWKLHANNLVPYLRGDDEDATSRQLVQREIKLNAKKNELKEVTVDLRQILDKSAASPGTYKLEARAERPYWLRSGAIICITDLAITTRQDKAGYHALVTSLRTAKPAQGVTVRAITYNNQTLAEAETDASGIAALRIPADHPDGAIFVVTAQLGDDLSYVQPGRRTWIIDEVDQSGKAYPKTYDVMLYPERGVYRPGDVVHLTGIVRDAEGQTPPPLPLVVRVKRPDGKQVAELAAAKTAFGQGVFHVDFPSMADGQTGRYTFTVTLPGSNQVLGQADALIEAFVPIRIEVKAQAMQVRFGPGEVPKVDVNARYLFGQPASQLPLVVSPTLKSTAFASKVLPDYSFNTQEPGRKVEIETIDAELDGEGKATITIALPDDLPKRLWSAAATTTVTELGGRSVSKNVSFTVDTIDRHLGLRLAGASGNSVMRTQTPIAIDWQLVNGSDAAIKPSKVRFQLDRLEHDWTLQDVDGHAVWRSSERSVSIEDETFEPDESRSFTVRCPEPGNHRLTLTEVDTGVRSEVRFFAAEQADLFTGPPVTSPQKLELILDKKAYAPGETAQLIVRSPFKGTLHVTVETNRVIEQHVIAMQENSATLELSVDRSFRGGAFITASVIRAIDPTKNKWLPHRAMGKVRLATDHDNASPVLELTAPQQAEPNESITVKVQTETPLDPDHPPVVHLWAVDDGILLTTGYRTPQLRDFFFAPRAAAVTAADVFSDLLPDHQRAADMSRIGAGDDEEMELRRSPVPMKQREAAIVWQTAPAVGPDGTLDVTMKMP
ncbi:MAG: MG2 domain-containing protein, partial [Phycisphaeraceae bacterium]